MIIYEGIWGMFTLFKNNRGTMVIFGGTIGLFENLRCNWAF
jgi:hypothetical protein